MAELVATLKERRRAGRGAAEVERLAKALALIDEVNAKDPRKVEVDGRTEPYRRVYGQWLTDACKQLDAEGPDELYILAR